MTATMKPLTKKSQILFSALANDADNWSGMPLVDINKDECWNLTDLKRRGLLMTYVDEDTFAIFTEKGKRLVKELGIDSFTLAS